MQMVIMARPVKIILNILSAAGFIFKIAKMNLGWKTKIIAKLKRSISITVKVDNFIVYNKSLVPFLGPLILLFY